MEPVDRTSENLRSLIVDLDAKLGTADDGITIIEESELTATRRTLTRGLPIWIPMLAVLLVSIGIATLAVQPWNERCTHSAKFCKVEALDIDALRVTIPDSALLAELPNIDALDPDDVLTAGDIFAMERFADVNFEQLISEEEIDLLLRYVE